MIGNDFKEFLKKGKGFGEVCGLKVPTSQVVKDSWVLRLLLMHEL
jgi:hypothetical protein